MAVEESKNFPNCEGCFANREKTCAILTSRIKENCRFKKPYRDRSLVNGRWVKFEQKRSD